MKRILTALTFTAALAAAGAAMAQPAGSGGPGGNGGPGRHHGQMMMSDSDRSALLDARIAAIKTGLKLTPEQEKLWPGVETALRDAAKARAARFAEWRAERKEMKGDPDARFDVVQRLRERADRMEQSAKEMKSLADAIEPLVKTLDDSQKRRLGVLMRQGAKGRMMAWHHMFGPRGGGDGPDAR